MVDVDDDRLLRAHDRVGTDDLEETVAIALELVADIENVDELVRTQPEGGR